MVDTPLYVAFVAAAFVLCVTPGPDMMFVVAMGGRGGPTTGVMAALGVAFGAMVHAVAAALGLSALFTSLPTLYDTLRWVGAAYLFYLAITAFRDRSDLGGDAAAAAGGPGPGRLRTFRQGAITNMLNPKVILFNVAFLPQFVNPSLGHTGWQLAILGLTLVFVGLTVDTSIGLLSGRLASLLRSSRRVARGLNVFSGTVFAGLAVRLATTSD
ncbi:LysE family translocator [Streptomyces sp. NPDC091272]|uniref:LysE family translocator n=1 Tax=Streptomyces sp. NPDC091272 TaxID=3365981 RepID=UPI003827AD1C